MVTPGQLFASYFCQLSSVFGVLGKRSLQIIVAVFLMSFSSSGRH